MIRQTNKLAELLSKHKIAVSRLPRDLQKELHDLTTKRPISQEARERQTARLVHLWDNHQKAERWTSIKTCVTTVNALKKARELTGKRFWNEACADILDVVESADLKLTKKSKTAGNTPYDPTNERCLRLDRKIIDRFKALVPGESVDTAISISVSAYLKLRR